MSKIKFELILICFFCLYACNSNSVMQPIEVINISSDDSLKKSEKEKPYVRNIIFMIGDGMGLSQVTAAMTVNGGTLNIEDCTSFGFSKTNSSDNYVTDSAAGGTAMATGSRTNNGVIGIDTAGNNLTSILEIAELNNYATGLVSTCSVVHATPASFIAHQPSRNMYDEIAEDITNTDIEVLIGGGTKFFSNRADKKDLIKKSIANDYQICYDLDKAEKVKDGKLIALLAEEHLPSMSDGRGDMLERSSMIAINILNQNKKGFFLMIEGSQIDWGGHKNSADYVISETIDFDNTIGKVLEFAAEDGHTLVVISADHETGGMAINSGNSKKNTVNIEFTSKGHTAVMVPVYAFGPGADTFSDIFKNTEFYTKFLNLWNIQQ